MSIERSEARSEMKTGFLRRLDDRVLPAVTRILVAVLRRRVALGWVAAGLAAVLLGGFLHAQRAGPHTRPAAQDVMMIGPVEGSTIADYIAASRSEVSRLSSAGTKPVFALVSLTGYGTPAQVAALSASYTVAKVSLRVPLPGLQTEIRVVDVTAVLRDVETQMRRLAGGIDADAKDAEAQESRLTGTSTQERQLHAFYAESARILRLQSSALRSLCACVYSLVVHASPQALSALQQRPGVRAVDPAPEVTSLDRLVVLPLLPEQRTTVEPPVDTGVLPAPG